MAERTQRHWLSACASLRLRLLPLVLLLIGVSTIFFFGRINGALNKDHFLSHQHMAAAINLSPSHHFLGFLNQIYDESDNVSLYEPYNKFTPGGYMLIKLVTLVVGDGLSIRIAAVQMLMVAFFAGAMVLTYWSLCRLITNRWIALTVVFLGFSSSMMLRFSTAIIPEIMSDLFGFLLTFHGMVIFAQKGRFRQLVIKACFALLFGWHVLALLLPFVLLGLAREIVQARKAEATKGFSLSLYLSRVVASRYLTLGFVVLGFGILILSYNIANEYYALNFRGDNQLALSDLPSVDSALRRTGTDLGNSDEIGRWLRFEYKVQWHIFLYSQLERLSYLAVPFSFPLDSWSSLDRTVPWAALAGISVVGLCLIGAVHLRRHRLLALTAILSGFCWTIPMRYNAGPHNFESLYYIGAILFFHTLILLFLHKWLGRSRRLLPLGTMGGLLLFTASSYRVAHAEIKNPDDAFFVDIESSIVDDIEVIRQFTDEKNILVYSSPDVAIYRPHGWFWYPHIWPYGGLFYYLHGSGLIFDSRDCRISSYRVDFILQPEQDNAQGLLTPDNRVMYLYDRHIYEERIDRIIERFRPVVRGGGFDVYLTDDRRLLYVGDRCTEDLRLLSNPVHLMVYPVVDGALSDSNQDHELHSFAPRERLIMDTERYVMIFDLPDYGIARIITGQSSSEGPVWGGGFFGPDHVADAELHQRASQIIGLSQTESGTAAVRGYFDVYLTDDGTLMYIREQCHNGDVSDGFFIHVFPVNRTDLPDHRRQSGFDNLDFAFIEHGSTDGQRCVAEIELPDYDIADITTGQFTDQGQTWQSELNAAGG